MTRTTGTGGTERRDVPATQWGLEDGQWGTGWHQRSPRDVQAEGVGRARESSKGRATGVLREPLGWGSDKAGSEPSLVA